MDGLKCCTKKCGAPCVMTAGVYSNTGSRNAKVICHQLGFPISGKHGWRGSAEFGYGTGPIWIDNLACLGEEEGLEYCTHDGWGINDCTHARDVSVYCDRG